LKDDGDLAEEPRPCEVFDFMVGTSTGGLIVTMLGRLHMTIDECITQYEAVGKSVFGKRPSVWRKFLQGMISWPFYDITVLQDEVKRVLYTKQIQPDEQFPEANAPRCKV
jgi:hypothetical protein